MSFASGFLGGLAQGKMGMDAKKQRDRELSIMEDYYKNGGPKIDPNPSVPSSGGTGSGEMGAIPQYDGKIGDRVTYAFNYFRNHGISDVMSSALVGNLMQESGADINPAAVGDNGNAYGAAQWNGPRMRAYKAFAAERGVDPSDFDTQLAFMMHEGKTTERGAWDKIAAAQNVDDAARIASEAYWRPGNPMVENRIAYARQVYANRPASENAAPAQNAPAPGQTGEMSIKDAAAGQPTDFKWFRQYFGG